MNLNQAAAVDELVEQTEVARQVAPESHWRAFGEWLDAMRISKRLGKGDLAERAGISDTQMRHYLTGKRVLRDAVVFPNPSEVTLHRIADAFDVVPAFVCAKAGLRCSEAVDLDIYDSAPDPRAYDVDTKATIDLEGISEEDREMLRRLADRVRDAGGQG